MIKINLDKAKAIGHDIRRRARAEEFAPYDEMIAKRIPGTVEQEAESVRQAIRNKYIAIQEAIDTAQSPEEIKSALGI